MQLCLATWQPSSRECTRAARFTTPAPRTWRTSSESIGCPKLWSSACWSVSKLCGRSTTGSTLVRWEAAVYVALLYSLFSRVKAQRCSPLNSFTVQRNQSSALDVLLSAGSFIYTLSWEQGPVYSLRWKPALRIQLGRIISCTKTFLCGLASYTPQEWILNQTDWGADFQLEMTTTRFT